MVTRKVLVGGGVYHVTQRAPGRELLFLEEGDYLRFLGLLKEAAEKYSLDIFCFALLPNHLHLLLRTANADLDRAMKFAFQSYAMGFNKKYQRKGHVFCGVYRATLCADDGYLLAASVYIHLNPFKAGLTSDPYDYRWFSLDPYVSSVKKTFIRPEVVLSVVDARDAHRARSGYADLIRESMKLAYDRSPEDAAAVRRFKETFIQAIHAGSVEFDQRRSRSVEQYLELEKKADMYRKTGVSREPKQRRAVRYLIEQLKSSGYSGTEIAVKLGMSRMTYYRLIRGE